MHHISQQAQQVHQAPRLVVDYSAVVADDIATRACRRPLSLSRRLAAEGIGTALLLAMVAGSAIMADRLAAGNAALALLANSLASGAGLLALLLAFGGISGAHLNPVVTLSLAWRQRFALSDVAPYIGAQIAGACAGVMLANAMFGLPLAHIATQSHSASNLLLGECVATFGLIAVGIACARSKPDAAPFAVAAYIVAGYWYTSSSSFANPALSIARMLTNSVAGIQPIDAMAYVCAEMMGGVAATLLFGWLLGESEGQE
jgi:glycerol uptake facilitator-like aquaporin